MMANMSPVEQKFMQMARQVSPGVIPQNPNYQQIVGEEIFEYVEGIVGDHAPKVTGMLIDLPIPDIHQYLADYKKFEEKVKEASKLLGEGGN